MISRSDKLQLKIHISCQQNLQLEGTALAENTVKPNYLFVGKTTKRGKPFSDEGVTSVCCSNYLSSSEASSFKYQFIERKQRGEQRFIRKHFQYLAV
jgi:hypothetical protein